MPINPYVMRGIAKGFETATQTLLNVSLKKKQLDRQAKADDMDYKIKSLQLEKLEAGMDPALFKMQNEELKNELKAKKAYRDFAMSYLDRVRVTAKAQSEKLDSYAKGITDEATANAQTQGGFQLGNMEFDLEAGLSGKFPYKQNTPSQQLKKEKATEELRLRKGAKEPLEKQFVPTPTTGWGAWEKKGTNAETTEYAKGIKTRQDLITLIQSEDNLESLGIDTDALFDFFEEEFIKLAQEGYLEKKK